MVIEISSRKVEVLSVGTSSGDMVDVAFTPGKPKLKGLALLDRAVAPIINKLKSPRCAQLPGVRSSAQSGLNKVCQELGRLAPDKIEVSLTWLFLRGRSLLSGKEGTLMATFKQAGSHVNISLNGFQAGGFYIQRQ